MDFNPDVLLELVNLDLFMARKDTIQYQAALALSSSLLKKWEPEDPKSLDAITIASFLASNSRCEGFCLPSGSLLDILNIAKSDIYDQFYDQQFQTTNFTLTRILGEGAAGPGSSRKTKHTDFYQKMFAGPLSTTSDILYKHYITNISDSWYLGESLRYSHFGVTLVSSSSLSTVPKNNRTNRTICTEPSLNMFYQLGAGRLIERMLLKYHNIDLSRQPARNSYYAKQGSITGEYATIDLSNASDTISFKLLEYLLPPGILSILDLIRSKTTSYQGEDIPLHMISSMGNGFTFPLQTLIFSALVKATYSYLGISKIKDSIWQYSVFGDDIIVCKDAYDVVTQVLNAAGFIVNETKSYNTGAFRESCGSDFFMGHNIRGVYLRKIKNETHIYSCFNRLVRWSIRNDIYLTRSLHYLKGLADFRPIPIDAGDSEGFKIPTAFLTAPKRDRNGAIYYRSLVAVPRRVSLESPMIFYNPSAVSISTVGGYIRSGRITLRSNEDNTFKVVKNKTPCWDYIPYAGLEIRDYIRVLTILM